MTGRCGSGATGAPPVIVRLGAPVAALAVAADGTIVAAGADGIVRSRAPDGTLGRQFAVETAPVTALALSPDGALIAVAPIRGKIELVDRASAQALRGLGAPEQVTWSLAFLPDGRALLSGGGDRAIRRWDPASGAEIGARPAASEAALDESDRGAVVFRACEACHTLTADGGNRAGPTLHGVFGRRIATAPGYNYSPALTKLDIVWNAETIARLFELGPATVTPGTKMPEQTIGDPADRAALVRFLEKATR
jgi:cytochrome c